MAECNFAENIEEINSITGNYNKSRQLFGQLKDAFLRARSVDFIVSFLMESGVKIILPYLREAIQRGVKVRILTGKYLGITQPAALYLLRREFGENIQLVFYNPSSEQSFHPKAYFFHYENYSDVFVGSSNISFSALTSGVEWNYRLSSRQNKNDYDEFFNTFEDLFYNHSLKIDDDVLKAYAKSWHKPAVEKDLERYENLREEDTLVFKECQPRGAQIEALYALEQSRREGADKGLVHAATGVGKTYLAAFDSKNYKHVLFVAHREEILNQAAASFANVRRSNDFGFFTGKVHDTDKAVIFASVASLGKDEYLNEKYFSPDYFDYIVVDEFHHAVNEQYKKIIGYFKTEFLLGLTATPERRDGRSIYELCDYNVPYEINLAQAINRGMLVPFHYYGIYDETDYSGLKFVKGDYLESELNVVYLNNEKRNSLIYKHYIKYNSKRALGFCCSRVHAEYMAQVFSKKGIPSVAVYSNADGKYSQDRKAAISMLESGKIKIIFSVDMFNEGVDIPQVDTVMFLRPTQSSTVFLQQLGRGLRTAKGKEYLNVLDFIGNYKYAGKNISLLADKENNISDLNKSKIEYPDGCLVDFEMDLIDLFNEMNKRKLSIHQKIQDEFFRIKELLNDKVPSRTELFTYMDDEIYNLCLSNAKENPFKNYLSFLNKHNLLDKDESVLFDSFAADFLFEVEKTSMTKSYKMPVLYSFFQGNSLLAQVSDEILLKNWKDFYSKNKNWKDLTGADTYQDFLNMTDKNHLDNIKKNPVHFLKQSASNFFVQSKDGPIALSDELLPFIHNQSFIKHFKDILNYRTMDYYSRRYRTENQDVSDIDLTDNQPLAMVAEEDK